ncbi:MAG: cysteine protease [Actinomyces sp.]|nr:cysteine protease [Actinomyces sp.]
MHSPFALLFPQLPGDLGSIWACQNEMRNRSRDIKSLHDDISALTITLTDWQGAAKVAFIDSKNNELPELITWRDGTLQAADALKNYYFKLEGAKNTVDSIRGQADDLWNEFRALPLLDRIAHREEYEAKLRELKASYNNATTTLSDEALNTAASLREALYFTPEDQIDTDGDGDTDTDLGETRNLTQKELEDIHQRLQDPSQSLFDLNQGRIGDCHLLSTLNAYNQTQKGREYLASLVTPHYNAQGKIDGYFVEFPGYERNEQRVFVQDVMAYGDTAGKSPKADLASIFEKAFIQSHPGGTKGRFTHGGASASLSTITMQNISGTPGNIIPNVGLNHGDLRYRTIDAIKWGYPIVAESSPFAGDAQATVGNRQENITIASSHVYTVAAADENGVTLINPWGHNDLSGRNVTTPEAAFTISWEEFYANYGDITIGTIP